MDKPLPEGEAGPKAEALAQKMLKAINHEQWTKTAAVKWHFAGKNQHLWDKERHIARVQWKDCTGYIDCDTRKGYVEKNGELISDSSKNAKLCEKAFSLWANDSYWLNPVSKIYDEGVVRKYVETEDGNGALLVTYQSGGVTPGDSYLWYVDANGLPYKWEMWVKIIPIGGVESSWDNWITSETGVKISTSHEVGPMQLEITNIETTEKTKDWWGKDDPFALLVKKYPKK